MNQRHCPAKMNSKIRLAICGKPMRGRVEAVDIRQVYLYHARLKGQARVKGVETNESLLQNQPLVTQATRDSLAIQIFQQRDRILPRYADEVFKCNYIEPGRLRLLRNYELS